MAVLFDACGASSDDWANGDYVDVLFMCGECGFGSLGSWSYLRNGYGILGQQVC